MEAERKALLDEALETIRRVVSGDEEIRHADRLRAAELLAKYAAAMGGEERGERIVINFYDDYGEIPDDVDE